MGRANQGVFFEQYRDQRGMRIGAVPDRRHSFRVPVPARAAVWRKGSLCGYYSVHDLSIGGCAMSGSAPVVVGDHLDLLIHLPRGNSMAVSAVVRRVHEGKIGLAFERTTPRAEDFIQDLVLEALASLRANAEGQVALVIEPNAEARSVLIDQLERCGQKAVGVATALDAVQLLVEHGERVECAFIEAESQNIPSFELVEYLAQHHPRVRRVLMGTAQSLGAYWTAEANGAVHALLETPCREENAERVLARIRGLPRDVLLS
jgi:CheY-like chemotaxis protein